MTREEYTYWTRITQDSRHQWMLDGVRQANTGELLLHKGGVDGIFVLIDAGGRATGGKYEGALPHIAEAAFHAQHERLFPSQDEAFASLTKMLGAQFLADLIRGTEMTTQETRTRILELEYQLINIDELEGFQEEATRLQNQINALEALVADIEP